MTRTVLPIDMRGGAEQHGGDADDGDGGERLQHRRGKRQDHAAPPGLVIGDHVGRDHRLAVAGAGGVEDAVDEGDAEQRIGGAAVGLGGADQARQLEIEFRLLGQDPAGEAARLRRRRCACSPNCASAGSSAASTSSEQLMKKTHCSRADRRTMLAIPLGLAPPPRLTRRRYGHFTMILLAKNAPQLVAASGLSLSFLPCGISHFARQLGGELALRRRADQRHRRLLGQLEIDEIGRIVDFDLEVLRLHRLLERQREVEREHLVLVVEEVVRQRLGERRLLAVDGRIGEIVVVLERLDIDLGERRQFLAREFALFLALAGPARRRPRTCRRTPNAGGCR